MSDPKFLRIVRQGDDLAKQNKYDSAIAKYQRALRMDPHSSDVRRKLIDMCKSKSSYRDAIAEYINWAEVCKRDGNYDEAIEIFQECLNLEKREGTAKKSSFFVRTPTADLGQVRDALEEYGAEIHWKLGLVYLAKGNLSDAEAEFKKSIEMNPANPAEIHKHLGLIYTELEKNSEAIGEYQEVLRLTPDDASVYEQLGDICYKQHKDTNAIQWFSQAGDIYLKKNEVQEAIRVYENILKIEPENIDILTRLSDIYSNEGLVDKAIQTCMRLADIYTKDGLLDKVILLYERLLDWEPGNREVREKVIEIYQKILTLDPGNLQARHKLINNLLAIDDIENAIPEFIALGKTYLDKNLYEEGTNICEKVFEFDAKSVDAHLLLAEIYTKQGLTDAAKEEYLLTMNLYRELGEHAKADETYHRMISLFPDSADMHYELALNHLEKGEYDDSIKEFKLVLESDPNHIPTLSKIGEIYIEKDMLEEGIDNFKKVLDLDAKNSNIRETLVDVYLSIGQIDEAIEQLLTLGNVYVEKEQFDPAVGVYRRVLCYMPVNLDVREKIVETYSLQGKIEKVKPEYIFLANAYDRRGNYMKSIEMCKKVLDMDPGDINVRKKLCNYYIKQGIPDIAVKEYISLADIYLEHNLISYAIEIFNNLLEIQPDSVETIVKLSELLSQEGRTQEAVDSYFSLIDIYVKSNMQNEARELYQKIIDMQPDNIDSYKKLSDMYLNFNEIDKAVNILHDLANIYKNKGDLDSSIDVNSRIGDMYISRKMFDEGLGIYEEILKLYSEQHKHKEQIPYYRRIIEMLSKEENIEKALSFQKDFVSVLSSAGDFDTAITECKDVVQTYIKMNKLADTTGIYRILLDEYLKLNRFDEAINECLDVVSLYKEHGMAPQVIEIYKVLVDIYFKVNRGLDAIEIQKAIGEAYLSQKDIPLAIESYELAAKFLINENREEESIDFYTKIIQLAPENLDYRQRLINLYDKSGLKDKVVEEYCSLINSQAKSGNLEKAVLTFQQALKDNNDSPVLHICMGNVYFDNQMWDEAIVNYLKVLDNSSGYPGIYSKLTLTCASKGDLDSAVEWSKKLIASGNVYELVDNVKINEIVDPQLAEAYYNWGIIYKKIGFIEDSIRAFIAASKESSRKLSSLKMIGHCFYQEGFKELASRQFRKILEIGLDATGMSDDEYLELRYDLGKTFEEIGKYKDAKKAYEGICEINIKFKDTMEKIMEMTRKIETTKEPEDTDPKLIEFSFETE
jgi:tetratricopeptide (TPR) repeat protein